MRIIDRTRRALPVAFLVATAGIPTAAQADHNWNCAGAHAIPQGVPWTGTVGPTDYDDWYYHNAFPLPVHTYTLTSYGGDADLKIWSACPGQGGSVLCHSNKAGQAVDECTVVGTGTHFVQVYYYSGGTVAYRLTVSNP